MRQSDTEFLKEMLSMMQAVADGYATGDALDRFIPRMKGIARKLERAKADS